MTKQQPNGKRTVCNQVFVKATLNTHRLAILGRLLIKGRSRTRKLGRNNKSISLKKERVSLAFLQKSIWRIDTLMIELR